MQPQEGSDSNAGDDTRSGEDSLTEDAPPSSTDGNVTSELQLKGSGRSSMESTEDSHVSLTLITPSPPERFSFECHAFQLREAHFLSKNLQIERGTHPLGLSSDGNKLIWLQRGAAPVDIYDIESQRRSKAVVLTGFETLVYWSFKEETKILSTDASLILYKTSKSCWKVRDRLTGNTLRHDFPNSLATWTQQVLPISKDCALVLLGHYRKGYTINRICRASSQGQKSLTWNYKVLPSSRDSGLHHLTLSRDGQNVTGLLGDTRQLLSCTWELSSAWFAEERVTGSRDVKDPIRVSLQHEDMKREVILGLASNSHTVTIVRGSIGVGASSHAGFRNTALRVTTFNLKSGAEISSSFVSASEIHGDHSKYSLFTDAKISADGKLLRTRVAKTPGIGSWLSRGALTDMETVLLRMEGLKVVHRFKEIWNSDYTEPITLSIFAPNFDMLARLTWRKRREDQTLRVWLEVYELKKTLEGAETNLGNQLIT
ncbi:hypothetical protein FLONG3_2924 [Fusarium longipes]|uniref:Uncharacterized protein n=1 Tax=Fusarium longipes TaxID=694270 RepID=A0A395T2T5_9HYPO|nr:hypothetical protein FLONG3_2924 [Fusarium longipes]